MKGRILGCSTNKYIHFIADTGNPVALIPRSDATRNKLEIFPTDPDEASYAGDSGTRLTVVGQCQEVRALVIADEGNEVLVGLETLIDWGIVPECFPFPMSPDYRAGASRDEPCFVRAVKEHQPENW